MTTYNRLFVVPTDETMSYLSSVLSGSAVDLDLQALRVEIISTEDGLEIDPARVYEAQAINVNVFYDSYYQQSSVIATLVSADLQARAKELNLEGAVRAGFPGYIPYMAIKRQMPALSRHYRTWRVTLANALCADERPMFFTGEHVETESLDMLPDQDYLEAMARDLQIRYNG